MHIFGLHLQYLHRNSIYIVITMVAGGILFNEKGIKKKLILSSILIICAYYLSVL